MKKKEQMKEVVKGLEKLLDRCEEHDIDKPCIQCKLGDENKDSVWFKKLYWNRAIREAISFVKKEYERSL